MVKRNKRSFQNKINGKGSTNADYSGLYKMFTYSALLEAKRRISNDAWINQVTGSNIFGRDKNAAFQFVPEAYFTEGFFDEMFRSDPITQKIIEIYPREAIRKGFKILGDDNKIVENVMNNFEFGSKLLEAAMWARLYGGAIIMLGIADGRSSSEPVDINNIQRIDYMHVYDRFQAVSYNGLFESDLMSPNYGNPVKYNITDPTTGTSYLVHSDRVLRINGIVQTPRRKLINNGWGESIITSCYTYIRNYCSGLNNISTMFNDIVKIIVKIPSLVHNLASNDNSVQARIDWLFQSSSNNNALVIDGQEEIQKVTSAAAGFPELFDRIALGLAAVVQIPAGMLFGIEPTGLNASGDYSTRNMYDSISAYQVTKLQPSIKKLAYYIMNAKDYNFGAIPAHWSVQFTPLEQMSELENAKIRRDVAEADKIYIEKGVLTPAEVAASRFGGDTFSLNTTIDKSLHESKEFYSEIETEMGTKDNPEEETVGQDV